MKNIPLVSKKKRILFWSDSCLSTTGFGIVSNNIMKRLYQTGRYEIDQLAINHFVDFYDTKQFPYSISPARLRDPRDPYGRKTFLDIISKRKYDCVFVINDSFVVHDLAPQIAEIRDQQHFCLVFYYPVDCILQKPGMIEIADIPVPYSNFAADETEKVLGWRPTDIIYHGVNTTDFYPINSELKSKTRQFLFGSDNKFVVANINRNTLRKDIPTTIAAFSEFRKVVPESVLYLHMTPSDSTSGYIIDLLPAIKHLGLELDRDVFFPKNYSPVAGFPVGVLNQIYGAADVLLTTHLGEGAGLSNLESLSAGVPVVVPDNTVTPELIEGRGYVYPCRELAYVDGCYSPDTEVLTSEGWVNFPNLTLQHKLCTMNTESEEIEYYYPEKIISKLYNGKFYSLVNRRAGIDIFVTEDHNILYSKTRKTKWLFGSPAQIQDKKTIKFKKNAKWVHPGLEFFVLPATKRKPEKIINMELWLEFLGYFLSEGSTTYIKKGSHFIVQLRQNEGILLDRMIQVFKDMGFSPHLRGDKNGVLVHNQQLYNYLVLLGKKNEKYIPRYFLDNCSKSQLTILFEALMKGDGHNLYYKDINKPTVSYSGGSNYTTVSIRLKDDFQELLLKIGLSGISSIRSKKGTPWSIEGRSGVSNYDCWSIGISYSRLEPSKQGYSIKSKDGNWERRTGWKEQWIDYSGMVYCATVKNHSMFVRHNGCCYWSGNSGYRKKGRIEDIVKTLLEAHSDWVEKSQRRLHYIDEGLKFAHKYTWDNVCRDWIRLLANPPAKKGEKRVEVL